MSNEVINNMAEEFKMGHKLISLHHYLRDGEEVQLNIEKEWLPYLNQEVHLLSPDLFLERNLIYLYIQELIELLPLLKAEGIIQNNLLNTVETLLLALDYLTDEQFINTPFTAEHQSALKNILKDCFKKEKSTSFIGNCNRPRLNKSPIFVDETSIYALDKRVERNRIYMAVLFKKPKDAMERFNQVGQLLQSVNLKPDRSRVSYEQMLEGKTDHDLHEDLVFNLSLIKRTFLWLLNSASWRQNDLYPFDKIDVSIKLGLK